MKIIPKNRLHLDFNLSTAEERRDFLNSYLPSLSFSPSYDELETISNYLLYGRNSSGKNTFQLKEVEDPSKSNLYRSKKVQSLNSLLEDDSSIDSRITPLNSTSYIAKKEVFSRQTIRDITDHSSPLYDRYISLWREIDSIDLLINFYEMSHNKRKQIREILLSRFSAEDQEALKSRANSLNEYTYLKYRHLLVEKRKEQYTLRDCVRPPLQLRALPSEIAPPPEFISEIPIFPFQPDSAISNLIFNQSTPPQPSDFIRFQNQLEFELKRSYPSNGIYFDFRNEDHLRALILFFKELEEFNIQNSNDSNSSISQFLSIFSYYRTRAGLSSIQNDILQMRIDRVTNSQINTYIKSKYQTNYTDNYISTIYKKIIKLISDAATRHFQTVYSIFFGDREFKKCISCGVFLPIDEYYFIRNHKCRDGFRGKCKRCERSLDGPYI